MFYIGLDVGQRRDHSAIVVVERVEVRRAYLPPAFARVEVRYAERVPLGTSFAGVVARVGEMVRHPVLAGECQLTVDGTGVGAPVVEMLRSARLGCEISEVTITGGERAHQYRDMGGTAWSVPKQDLLMSVQVLLEREELKIARDLKEAGTLVKELMDVRAGLRWKNETAGVWGHFQQKEKKVSQGRGGRKWYKYSPEFKRSAVDRVASGESPTAVARELGIRRKFLYAWNEEGKGSGGAPPKVAKETVESNPQQREIRRLEKKIADLERLTGRQTAELDFFAAALRRVREAHRNNGATSGAGSTK